MNSGYAAYREAQAQEVDQAKLILMMFSGSVNYLNKAIEYAETDHKEMERYISRTKNIILELIASLNLEDSGEIGELLLKTYRGLFTKLNLAYVEEDIVKVTDVRDSLIMLEDSWKKVFQSPEYDHFKNNREQFVKNQQKLRKA
ncbi:MAG: flagellar export chaperone FliS [Candidatus Latescibacteria bacterium]|nr:flagellar export chaperone FliS [Candidatus Latescibacterota bacterium]